MTIVVACWEFLHTIGIQIASSAHPVALARFLFLIQSLNHSDFDHTQLTLQAP